MDIPALPAPVSQGCCRSLAKLLLWLPGSRDLGEGRERGQVLSLQLVIHEPFVLQSMTLKEAIKSSLVILKQVMEEKLNATNIEVSPAGVRIVTGARKGAAQGFLSQVLQVFLPFSSHPVGHFGKVEAFPLQRCRAWSVFMADPCAICRVPRMR